MRKGWTLSAILVTAAMAVAGCVNDKTGDVGHKNLRPYYANDYEKNRLPINGTHSFGSPTYRTRFANDQAQERNRWMGRNQLGNNVVRPNENYRLEIDERLARQIADMPEVGSAYVLLTDSNAYVAVTASGNAGTAGGADVNGNLKNKIASRVRAASPAIQDVYVTDNPEFVDRLRYYSQAASQGHPVQDFLAEFNALTARIFPTATS